MSEFNLDRETNIENNIDASGKKWEVLHKRGTALYLARPVPDRKDAIIPGRFAGMWTKAQHCQEQISIYVKNSWLEADRVRAKNARSNPAPVTSPHPDTPSAEEMIATAEAAAPVIVIEPEVVVEPEVVSIPSDPVEDTQAALQAQIDADNAEFEAKNAARTAEITQEA